VSVGSVPHSTNCKKVPRRDCFQRRCRRDGRAAHYVRFLRSTRNTFLKRRPHGYRHSPLNSAPLDNRRCRDVVRRVWNDRDELTASAHVATAADLTTATRLAASADYATAAHLATAPDRAADLATSTDLAAEFRNSCPVRVDRAAIDRPGGTGTLHVPLRSLKARTATCGNSSGPNLVATHG
jgi:hypothetical protein